MTGEKSLGQIAWHAYDASITAGPRTAGDYELAWEAAAQAVASRVRADTIKACAMIADAEFGSWLLGGQALIVVAKIRNAIRALKSKDTTETKGVK